MLAIVDYGVGNLFSLRCSLEHLGFEVEIATTEAQLQKAERIILPGVGAFGDAINKLTESGLGAVIVKQASMGKPLLGICLGMQLLFERSSEFGNHTGLGLLKGDIVSLKDAILNRNSLEKVPHIGWNQLEFEETQSPLLKGIKTGDFVYYVHSYYFPETKGVTVASSQYGVSVSGVVQNKNVIGMQFHPEKSGDTGLALLKAFAEEENLC